MQRPALTIFGGIAALAVLTFGARAFHLNLPAAGFLDLLVVVAVSTVAGFAEASIISLLAVASLNYFFTPPVFTFRVADPQNWIALGAFEATALLISKLSSRVKSQAKTEARQRLLLERLFELSRRILSLDLRQAPGPQVVALIREIFKVEAAVIFDAAPARLDATKSCPDDLRELGRNAYLTYVTEHDGASGTWQRALRRGPTHIGAIVLKGGELDRVTVDAIASLTAITLERARSFDAESRAEAVRHSEELRAAVLDGLAHAFKTPLTVIRAASSGLLETGRLADGDTETVALIEQETERLNQLTTRLLQMARIGEAHLHRERISISTLIEAVLAHYREQLRGHAVRVLIQPPDLSAAVDRELVVTGLGQLIDNAAKYSNPGSPIAVSAEGHAGDLVISVHNEGPAISAADRDRIFERFYRADDARSRASGTGLGLSIAKQTAEAHGGRVSVVSEEGEGTTFRFVVPQRIEGKP